MSERLLGFQASSRVCVIFVRVLEESVCLRLFAKWVRWTFWHSPQDLRQKEGLLKYLSLTKHSQLRAPYLLCRKTWSELPVTMSMTIDL